MRFDRLDMEGRDSGVGRLYWLDLRLIREAKGIDIKTVHERTRVPMETLSSFERGGLKDKKRFNYVYRRSLAAAYAEAIEIDPDDVLRSAEESQIGRYRGRLARNYLDVELPKPDLSQGNGIGSKTDAAVTSKDRPATASDGLEMIRGSVSVWPQAVEPLATAFSNRPLRIIAGLVGGLIVVWLVSMLV